MCRLIKKNDNMDFEDGDRGGSGGRPGRGSGWQFGRGRGGRDGRRAQDVDELVRRLIVAVGTQGCKMTTVLTATMRALNDQWYKVIETVNLTRPRPSPILEISHFLNQIMTILLYKLITIHG